MEETQNEERNLIKLGLDPETAWKSSVNGRGAWWKLGAGSYEPGHQEPPFRQIRVVL